jgi:hypothetical protein
MDMGEGVCVLRPLAGKPAMPSIGSGTEGKSVAEKRSKQRTTAYTRLLAHAKDAQPLVTLTNIE